MPTIFEKIETALAESAVDVQINVQIGQLGAVQFSLRQFSENGRAGIESFIQDLKNVPPPKSLHAADLEASFQALLAAFPDELSGVSVETTQKTDEIIQYVEDAYLGPLGAFYELYRCIDELMLKFQGAGFSGGSNAGNQNAAPFASANVVFSPALVAGLGELGQAFDDLIVPIEDVDSLLLLAAIVLSYIPREYFSTAQVAYLDEIRQVVETLVEWSQLSDSALAAKLEQSLSSMNTFLAGCFADLQPLIAAAENAATQFNDLYTQNDPNQDILDITAGLDQLAIAIHSADLTQVNAALNTLNPKTAGLKTKLQAISTGFFDSNADDELAKTLEDLLDQLEDKMLILLNQLKPAFELDAIQLFPDTFPPKEIDLELDNILEAIQRALSGLCKLVHKLNLDAIAGDFQTATLHLNQKITDWKAVVDAFYVQLQDNLEDVQTEVDNIDIAEIMEDAKKSIQDFEEQLTAEIELIFQKIQKVINDFVILAENTAGAYSYDDLEQSLDTFMQSVSEVLMEYQDDLERIKKTMQQVTEKLKTYSFKTVSDLVVNQIDEVTAELKEIDTENTNPALVAALNAALLVLPVEEELRAKMDQLQDELDHLIEEGPVALLNKIKDKPAELLEAIKAKSPVPLIKEKLSGYYRELLEILGAFEPNELLQPLKDQLTELDALIAAAENPCRQLDVIVALYADLLAAVDRFKPGEILAFLEAEKARLAAAVDKAIPEDFVDEIIQRLQSIEDAPQKLSDLLQKVCDLAANFDDPEDQLDDWLAVIYTKIDNLSNIPSLDNLIQDANDQVNSFEHDEIDTKINANLLLLVGALQTLDPKDQLTNLLLAYNGVVTSPIDDLPEPERTKVLLFLADFDPFKPTIEANLVAFQGLLEKLQHYKDQLTDWKTLFLGPNSPLHACLPTSANIKQLIKDCIEAEFREPLLALLSFLPQIKTFVTEVKIAVDAFIACLPNISGFSNGLINIDSAIDSAKSLVTGLSLEPLYDLETLYATVRNKLNQIDLAGLQNEVCAAFDDMRNNIRFSELLTQAQIDSLDASYQNLLSVAEQFDPVAWVEENLEGEFERLLGPYLDDFDLSAFFTAMIERLEQLKQELRDELDRIYKEFTEMLDAVPNVIQININ